MFKYIGSSLKRFLPYFIIFASILFACGLIYLASEESVILEYHTTIENVDYAYVNGNPYGGLMYFAIPTFILVAIAPLIANAYRYSLKSVDFYYQNGKGNKAIRFTNNIVMLLMILIIFSVIYFTSYFFLFIKQIPFVGRVEMLDYVTIIHVVFNYGFVVLAHPLLLSAIVITYFISYLFVTRSNNLINSMITLVFGHLILGLVVMMPLYYYDTALSHFDVENFSTLTGSYLIGARGISPLSFTLLIDRFFNPLINTSYSLANFKIESFQDVVSLVIVVISHLLMISLFVFSFIMFICEKESSGEFAGKAKGRDLSQEIIFHAGFVISSIGMSLLSGLLGTQIFTILFIVANTLILTALYFALSGLLRRRFRFKLHEWLIFVGLSQVYFISSLILFVLSLVGDKLP